MTIKVILRVEGLSSNHIILQLAMHHHRTEAQSFQTPTMLETQQKNGIYTITPCSGCERKTVLDARSKRVKLQVSGSPHTWTASEYCVEDLREIAAIDVWIVGVAFGAETEQMWTEFTIS